MPFTFDDYSLAAISASLVLLDMPSVNLVECRSLYFLEHLYQLNLQNNKIADFQEQLAPVLVTLSVLKDL